MSANVRLIKATQHMVCAQLSAAFFVTLHFHFNIIFIGFCVCFFSVALHYLHISTYAFHHMELSERWTRRMSECDIENCQNHAPPFLLLKNTCSMTKTLECISHIILEILLCVYHTDSNPWCSTIIWICYWRAVDFVRFFFFLFSHHANINFQLLLYTSFVIILYEDGLFVFRKPTNVSHFNFFFVSVYFLGKFVEKKETGFEPLKFQVLLFFFFLLLLLF